MSEIDHAHTDEVTCPHCGAVQGDSWERLNYQGDGDERADECYECEKPYFCWPTITVSWTTKKVTPEPPAPRAGRARRGKKQPMQEVLL